MFSCRPPPADNEWPFYDALPFVYKAKCHCHLRFICFGKETTQNRTIEPNLSLDMVQTSQLYTLSHPNSISKVR